MLRPQSRHRLPADRRRDRLCVGRGDHGQGRRRRFPRRQDDPAGDPRLRPRQRSRTRLLARGDRPASASPTTTSPTRSGCCAARTRLPTRSSARANMAGARSTRSAMFPASKAKSALTEAAEFAVARAYLRAARPRALARRDLRMNLPIDAVLPDLLAALRGTLAGVARCAAGRGQDDQGRARACSTSNGAPAGAAARPAPARRPRRRRVHGPELGEKPGRDDRLCHAARQQGRQEHARHRHDPRRVPLAHPGRSRAAGRICGAVRRGARAQPRQ